MIYSRIVVVGCGAVGAYVGGHLARLNKDVVLVDPYPEHVETLRSNGLRVAGPAERDNFVQPVTALHVGDVQLEARRQPFDLALISVKAYDTAWAVALVAPYVSANGLVASMQNGLNDTTVARFAGLERTVGVSVSGCGVELVAPGYVKRSNLSEPGKAVFRVGELSGPATARTRELARLLSQVDSSVVIDDLMGERWSKLVINCMRMGLAAVTGIGMPEQDLNPVTQSLMIRLAAEAMRVGQMLGHVLVPVLGVEPAEMLRADSGSSVALARVIEAFEANASRYPDPAMPSLAQDILRGRRTEVDAINGVVVSEGRRLGVETPLNSAILALVRKLENGEFQPMLEVVRHL